jgi:hypothetical protein
MTTDPRERLRQIIAKYPKTKNDPAKLWRIFESEIHGDRALAAAVLREAVAERWFPRVLREL